jgi:transcriptional regulator with XRE-family HTH domain
MITAEDLNYAKKLKVLRKAAQWKQMVAAEEIGISSQQEYSKLESGKLPFTDDLLKRICKAFQVTPDHFKEGMIVDYKVDLRDYINEKKITDLVELINNRGLVALWLDSERRAMRLELELIELKLKALLPKHKDIPDDTDYNIWVLM